MKKPIPFGKYLLVDRINVGGMAEVFLARPVGDPSAPCLAIKRILPTMVEDDEFLTMFLDEARISVQLNHPNVVQIHELGRHGDSIYIAMDYVSGKDLRQLLDRHRARGRTISIPQALHIAVQVCEGLEYAHRKKDGKGVDLHIVHRDVTPQNILLSYRGEVKLIDFGIAKAANRIQKTQAGILKGKFGYMSPEQVLGMPVDHRSDLFAVGVTIFEMLTGERLFAAESDFSTLERVRIAQVPSPRGINAAIPEELERILFKALAREPSDRHASCGELGRDLADFMRRSGFAYSSAQLGHFLRDTFAEDCAREQARLGSLTGAELEGDEDTGPEKPTRPMSITPQTLPPWESKAVRERSGPPVLYNEETGGAQVDLQSAHTVILSSAPSASKPSGVPTLVDEPIVALIEHELRDSVTVIGLARAAPRAKEDPKKQPTGSEGPPGGIATGRADEPQSSEKATPAQRGKRTRLIIAAAAVLAAASLAALWALRPRSGQLTVRADPADAAIFVDGALAASGVALMLPPGKHVVEARAGGRKPYRAELELAAGAQLIAEAALELERDEREEPAQAEPEGAPVAPARPSRFDLKVESQPSGAAIEVGGRHLGETPAILRDREPSAVQMVSLSLKGYRTAQIPVSWDGEKREVAVFAALERIERAAARERAAERPAGARAKTRPAEPAVESGPGTPIDKKKEAARPRASGKLITNSEPVARVAIDGKDSGRWTPISPSQPIEVPAGEHVVTYIDGDGRKAVRAIAVPAGETVKIVGVKDFK